MSRRPALHGTDSAYYRHVRGNKSEPPSEPCEPCKEAHREAVANYARRRKAAGAPLPKAKAPRKSCPACGTSITSRATYCRSCAGRRRRPRGDVVIEPEEPLAWVLIRGIWRAAPERNAS